MKNAPVFCWSSPGCTSCYDIPKLQLANAKSPWLFCLASAGLSINDSSPCLSLPPTTKLTTYAANCSSSTYLLQES
eukprot:scaffold4855_cov22-Prasinocladus_malaysianus.AAC.1